MIEVGKTYYTRDGRPVRILVTDREGCLPIVGLVDNRDVHGWQRDGTFNLGECCKLDIIPERESVWINWYGESNGYMGRKDADNSANRGRTHVLEVIMEGGNPVDVKIHKAKK